MDLASIVCAFLADRIASEKERQADYDRWQAEIDEVRVEIEGLKTDDET